MYFLFRIKETCVHSLADSTGWVLFHFGVHKRRADKNKNLKSHTFVLYIRVLFSSSSIQSVCDQSVFVCWWWYENSDVCIFLCRRAEIKMIFQKKECRVATTTEQFYKNKKNVVKYPFNKTYFENYSFLLACTIHMTLFMNQQRPYIQKPTFTYIYGCSEWMNEVPHNSS